MDIREFEIPDVKLIVPKRFTDARGYFSETWSDRLFREEIADVSLRTRQSIRFSEEGNIARSAFPKTAFCPRQIGAGSARIDPRRRRRHS